MPALEEIVASRDDLDGGLPYDAEEDDEHSSDGERSWKR